MQVSYQAPSNIALVKYWGKRDRQIPMNPSVSMTLAECYTETKLTLLEKTSDSSFVEFLFDGVENNSFAQRIEKYLDALSDKLDWIEKYSFKIESKNSFPHSAGIASSASAFAALASCLEDIDAKLHKRTFDYRKASFLARLGSGSASRSIQGKFMLWGHDPHITNSSNEYAIALDECHEVFENMKDAILIISSAQKKVGSSVGHNLMNGHLFKELRYQQARDNFNDMIQALKIGDLDAFGNILEAEALTLHALMMTSHPSFILMEPQSLNVINKVRQFRKETGIPLYFTLDAGPNVHLLYPDHFADKVEDFIKKELLLFCEEDRVIYDHIGMGTQRK